VSARASSVRQTSLFGSSILIFVIFSLNFCHPLRALLLQREQSLPLLDNIRLLLRKLSGQLFLPVSLTLSILLGLLSFGVRLGLCSLF
jgi:hypothetical protein